MKSRESVRVLVGELPRSAQCCTVRETRCPAARRASRTHADFIRAVSASHREVTRSCSPRMVRRLPCLSTLYRLVVRNADEANSASSAPSGPPHPWWGQVLQTCWRAAALLVGRHPPPPARVQAHGGWEHPRHRGERSPAALGGAQQAQSSHQGDSPDCSPSGHQRPWKREGLPGHARAARPPPRASSPRPSRRQGAPDHPRLHPAPPLTRGGERRGESDALRVCDASGR